jgi:RimJ/RimL family protein N-acetyltransferase
VSGRAAESAIAIPLLKTPRLVMRGFRAEDHEPWFEIVSDDDTMRAVGQPAGLDEVEAWSDLCRLAGHWMLRGYGQWALEERASGELVGRAGLINHADWPDLEVGWLVKADRRGRGYAPEAAASSRRVAEKLGERPYERVVVRGEELAMYRIDR